jgi:hypothetical protein
VEHYLQSLQRAGILADFERQLREAVREDAKTRIEALTARYLDRYAWLADDFYRKIYLRGRRRAVETRVRTYERLLAGHNPKTVRYLSEEWRNQRDEANAELRELEATMVIDPPPWEEILAQYRAQLRASDGREDEE